MKIGTDNQTKVVGLVALRPNQPASSGRPKECPRGLQSVPAHRSARRDGSQREPFHLLLRRPSHHAQGRRIKIKTDNQTSLTEWGQAFWNWAVNITGPAESFPAINNDPVSR